MKFVKVTLLDGKNEDNETTEDNETNEDNENERAKYIPETAGIETENTEVFGTRTREKETTSEKETLENDTNGTIGWTPGWTMAIPTVDLKDMTIEATVVATAMVAMEAMVAMAAMVAMTGAIEMKVLMDQLLAVLACLTPQQGRTKFVLLKTYFKLIVNT